MSNNNSKQAFWVLLGALSAFIFSLVSAIILSRYFNKADYGTYKQILYVYNSLLVIFTLGLPRTYSFFLPRVPIEEAKSVIKKINNILIVSGLCMGCIIYFGAELIANLLNNNELINPLRYFSLVPVFMLPTIGLEGILGTYIQGKAEVYFGNYVQLAPNVGVLSSDHDLYDQRKGYNL